jgi:uncharacterized membrane protein YhaH (DUF805 family)
MEAVDWYKNVLTRHYADFHGRARRAEFWNYVLVSLVIFVLLALIGGILGLRIVRMLYALAVLVPNLAVGVRRLHDIGKSGWLVLLPVAPAALVGFFFILLWPLALFCGVATIICAAYLIYLYVQPGTSGPNQYGPDPKGVMAAATA